jgi:uncharacterized protein (TIGR03067 family)
MNSCSRCGKPVPDARTPSLCDECAQSGISTPVPGPSTGKKVLSGVAVLGLLLICGVKGAKLITEHREKERVWTEKQQKADQEKRAAAHQQASRHELQRLEGAWMLISEESNGAKQKEDPKRRLTFRLEGAFDAVQCTWRTGGERGIVRFPDDDGTPKSIDLVRTSKSRAVKTLDGQTVFVPDTTQVTYLGIYSIEGDTLRLCRSDGRGKERPREFVTKQGDGFTCTVWQRNKK